MPSPALAKPIHVFKTSFGSSTSIPPNPYPLVGPSAVAVNQTTQDVYVTSPGIDERQVITVPDTDGTFTLTFNGQTTPPLHTAQEVPKALDALSTIGPDNLSLVHLTVGDIQVLTFRFVGTLSGTDVPQITADNSARPSNPVTITTSRPGAPGHAVEKFTPSGEFLATFGKEVNKTKVEEAGSTVAEQNLCTAASGDICQVGTSSSAPGSLQDPTFIAVDNSGGPSQGDIYVADAADNLITKFDEEGHLISSWAEGGQLGETPITASGSGDIVVGSATGSGDVKAGSGFGVLASGSHTVTSVNADNGQAFAVGMEFFGTRGIPDGTTITAVGSGTLTLSNPATETGERGLKAGSKTVENVVTSTGAFAVGLGIEAPGAIRGNTYITAIGPGTLTLSKPPESSRTGAPLTTNTRFVTNLNTSTGAFERSQTISGAGIPAGTKIQEVGSEFLALENNATVGGVGVSLSAKFIFGSLFGVAVDPSGNLWLSAAYGGGNVQTFEFAPAGAFVTDWPGGGRHIAIDSSGDLFMVEQGATKFAPSGSRIGAVEDTLGRGGRVTGLAIDSATDDLYVDNGTEEHPGTEVTRFPASCEPAAGLCTPAEVFGSGSLSEGQGLAVGPGHLLYAADAGDSTVKVFEQVNVPTATTGQASNLAQATATLNGEVNPEGVAVSECLFEYVAEADYQPKAPNPYAAGQTAPCVESVGSGNSPVAVHADLPGLAPAAYHFRLFAKNANGADRGADRVFGASVDSSSVQSATTSEATLAAQINPNGLDTTCQLQYVDEAGFNASQFTNATTLPCEPADLGSGSTDQGASVILSGLQPGTAYRFRFLATSAGHTTEGPAEPLYTHSGTAASSGCAHEALREENTSLGLPDCRAYEQVSPSDNAEVYVPDTQNFEGGLTTSQWPMQASSDGEAVTYVGEAPSSGEGEGSGTAVSGIGDMHLASRGAQGWAAADIIPFGAGGKNYYEEFSDDLSLGMFHTGPSTEPVPAGLEETCLYSRTSADGSFHPIIAGGDCGNPFFVGASADGSHLLFESTAAKTPGAQEAAGEGKENIYDFAGGQLHLVNVLPGTEPKPDPNASVGSLSGEPGLRAHEPITPAINADNVVSADGSRVFWTDVATGIVYVRENPAQGQSKVDKNGKCTQAAKACTVAVSAGSATYQTATPDGRYAYYTEAGELWRFDVQEGTREALASGPAAKVQAVIGVNETGEDGAYLYFVAEGALAPGAEARACKAANTGGTEQEREEAIEEAEGKAPAGRGCNLYLLHAGQPTLVAVLLAADNKFSGAGVSGGGLVGDWRAALGYRSAQLTPDGRHLVFMSERRLTAYDNVNAEGKCGGTVHSCSEVYLYDAEAEAGQQISCASCNPTGAPPAGVANQKGQSTYLPFSVSSITRTPRWISADGSRVFFNSAQHLLPADTNGHQGVYEWERASTGSCAKGSPANGGGCLYLLSGATATNPAYLVDIDEKGENAFFITRSNLAPTDGDNKPDLYDARVNGGFPVPAALPPCEVDACKGPIASAPSAKSPGSASFQADEQSATVRCKKGKVKKRGKCVSQKHHKAKKHSKKKRRAANNNRRADR